MDFKQSNKLKKKEWIEDYWCQICAYAAAHNEIYGTNINTGVVLICTADLEPQIFEISGGEFDHYTNSWWDRVDSYYRNHHHA
jgi:genome maintenance exonuclease 1